MIVLQKIEIRNGYLFLQKWYIQGRKGLDLRAGPARMECPQDQGYKKKFQKKCKWNWVDIGEARIFFLETGGF